MNRSNRFNSYTTCFDESLNLSDAQQTRLTAIFAEQHAAILSDSELALTPDQKARISEAQKAQS